MHYHVSWTNQFGLTQGATVHVNNVNECIKAKLRRSFEVHVRRCSDWKKMRILDFGEFCRVV